MLLFGRKLDWNSRQLLSLSQTTSNSCDFACSIDTLSTRCDNDVIMISTLLSVYSYWARGWWIHQHWHTYVESAVHCYKWSLTWYWNWFGIKLSQLL